MKGIVYGIQSERLGHIDISYSLLATKAHATRNGYSLVSARGIASEYCYIVAVKIDNDWINITDNKQIGKWCIEISDISAARVFVRGDYLSDFVMLYGDGKIGTDLKLPERVIDYLIKLSKARTKAVVFSDCVFVRRICDCTKLKRLYKKQGA